ncbi:MAG: sigma-54 dependent transcriptional regulator [Calditrichia bacterium]|jgi:DNA-binding NtrC family response regulator
MMKKNKILIVEDNLVWREKYKKWLGESYIYVDSADAVNAARTFDAQLPDLVILDLGLPRVEQGFELLDNIIAKSTDVEVIVITSSKDHKHALEAQKRGANSYFFKGENIKDELPFLVGRALKMQALQRENKKLRQKLDRVFNFDNIIAVSKPMYNILALIEKIKVSSESVLITGESGVGKEVIARHIHFRSKRLKSPFIALNCAAMPENLLENELFGHEKGAFTGATDLKQGKIELAAGGTLFLDEMGDMPTTLQAKILRVLQEKNFYRLGGSKEITINFRLITATNKELSEEVKNKNFREDLYYRLNVIPIHIPPLRERPDDIPALIDYIIQKYCTENHISVPRVDGNLISHLSRLNWEGNIRQLENTLKRMLVLNHKSLTLSDLPGELSKTGNSILEDAFLQNQSLEDLSKKYAHMVLNHFDGNKKEACKFLNINYRTLQRKLQD